MFTCNLPQLTYRNYERENRSQCNLTELSLVVRLALYVDSFLWPTAILSNWQLRAALLAREEEIKRIGTLADREKDLERLHLQHLNEEDAKKFASLNQQVRTLACDILYSIVTEKSSADDMPSLTYRWSTSTSRWQRHAMLFNGARSLKMPCRACTPSWRLRRNAQMLPRRRK